MPGCHLVLQLDTFQQQYRLFWQAALDMLQCTVSTLSNQGSNVPKPLIHQSAIQEMYHIGDWP